MKITRSLIYGLYAYVVGIVVIYLLNGPGLLADLTSVLLIIALAFVCQVILKTTDKQNTPFDVLLVLVIFTFFNLRFMVLMLYPDQYIFPWLNVDSEDINQTLFFLLMGVVVATAGFRLGSKEFFSGKRTKQAERAFYIPTGRLFILTLVYIGIQMILWFTLGTASSYLGESESGGLLFLRHFVSVETVVMIATISAIESWRTVEKVDRYLFYTLIGVAYGYSILSGSRAGFFTLGVLVFIYLTIKHGDFVIGRKHVSLLGAALLISIVMFPVATLIRGAWTTASERGSLSSVTTDIWDQDTAADTGFGSLLLSQSDRVNGLDPLLIIVRQKDVNSQVQYVNIEQTVKSTVNVLVPSAILGRKPFPGVMPASRLFTLIYRGRSEDQINTNYQTDMWTLWGISYALFGWSGGIAVIFIVSFIAAVVYKRLGQMDTKYSLLLRVWWIFSIFYLLLSYGFDTTTMTAVDILLQGGIAILLLRPRAHDPARALPASKNLMIRQRLSSTT